MLYRTNNPKYAADGRLSDFSGFFGPHRLPIRHKKFIDTLSETKLNSKDLKIFSSIYQLCTLTSRIFRHTGDPFNVRYALF